MTNEKKKNKKKNKENKKHLEGKLGGETRSKPYKTAGNVFCSAKRSKKCFWKGWTISVQRETSPKKAQNCATPKSQSTAEKDGFQR